MATIMVTNIPNNYLFNKGAIVQHEWLPEGGSVTVVADGAPAGVPYYSAPPPLEGTGYLKLDYKESQSGPGTEKTAFVLKPQFDYFTLQTVQPKIDHTENLAINMFLAALFGIVFLAAITRWLSKDLSSVTENVEAHDDDLYGEEGKLTKLETRIWMLEKQKIELRGRIQVLEDKANPPSVS